MTYSEEVDRLIVGVVRGLARKFSDQNQDDMLQASRLRVLENIYRIDQSRDWKGYVARIVYSAVRKLKDYRVIEGRTVWGATVSLSQPIPGRTTCMQDTLVDESESADNALHRARVVERALSVVTSGRTPRPVRDLIGMRLMGEDGISIVAKRHGITRQCLHFKELQMYQKARISLLAAGVSP